MRSLPLLVSLLVALALLPGGPGAERANAALRQPVATVCDGCKPPPKRGTWQYQLLPSSRYPDTGGIAVDLRSKPFGKKRSRLPRIFDIDLYVDGEVAGDGSLLATDAVEAIHARGGYAICYVSAGSWENWRPDAQQFPQEIRGEPNGWPGEKWLDIRAIDVLLPLMETRVEKCVEAGFDAIEFDNVDGYTNDTGFPLSGDDQLAYNGALAAVAHDHGLAAGLKNDLEQVADLVDDFDFAVNEQCRQYRECSLLKPFLDAGKRVLQIEYEVPRKRFCRAANRAGRTAILKTYDLRARPWKPCA